jgi:hypothetical protein
MEFNGHLTIGRPGIIDRIRETLPDRLAADGFAIFSAVPLRARRKLSWFQRLRREVRRTGGRFDFSVRMANGARFEFPFGPTGEIAYTISIPHHGRVIGSLLVLASLAAYFLDSFFPALFIAVIGSGLVGIGLHYAMRKSIVRYLGLLPSQYTEHRLSIG